MKLVIALGVIIVVLFGAVLFVDASEPVVIHFFERSDCGYCKAENVYLDALVRERGDSVRVVRHDIGNNAEAKALFVRVTESVGLPKVTPVTVIGTSVLQGFDEAVTRESIERVIATSPRDQLTEGLEQKTLRTLTASDKGCDTEGLEPCTEGRSLEVTIPFLGTRDVGTLSLGALSFTLGFIDGFNPCAMWVLITFLLLLSQIQDRKKMIFAASAFIVAEAIIYALILTVWYSVWDFVALDRIVTPLVGAIALGGGTWFLYRYARTPKRAAFTCDVTTDEQSGKIVSRLEKIVSGPISIMMFVMIVGVAFSVNIIEFACSLGIPQAYTKILELNQPTFMMRQMYVGLYTLAYMVDDLIVFALAVWGFSYVQAHGARYARYSLLIGGVGLLLLGALLVFAPEWLVWAK